MPVHDTKPSASPPVGTITFLFTDIEGSTRLWEEHPDAMRIALARHDALLRQAIANHNGYLIRTVGDAFYAAFATAPDALSAALTAQIELVKGESEGESSPFPPPSDTLPPLRVRMALHTGAAESRDNEYFGQPLNRIARLLTAAHGGQTLLSDVTHDLCRDNLPLGVSLKPLGVHYLRDLARPETVFQLLHADLPTDFPPLKSLNNPASLNNLPPQMTTFIGREKAIADSLSLLKTHRLLTLTGSGGCGKTRLSLQVAANVLAEFPDGVYFVELAAITDPALVPQAAAQAVGVKEAADTPLTQTLTERLKGKRLLLALDNCEHLLTACAPLADALLKACPQVKILASSRERLGVAGEQTYRVPSLSWPDPKQAHTPETLSHYEAALLFLDRALLARSDFQVTNQNAPALAALCHRLNGIPLAIELAAARVRSLSVEEINARSHDLFHLLTGGSRTILPRHQTLDALIGWSYDLLTEAEKILLHRLSAFAGGWTLEAAESVCVGDAIAEGEIFDLLMSLTDKTLMVAVEREGATRYHFMETVRQYAAKKLAGSGETEALRRRHRDYYLRWVESIGNWRFQPPKIIRMEPEYDNLRSALDYCHETADGAESGLRLVCCLIMFWENCGYVLEELEHISRALAHPGVVPSPAWRDVRVAQQLYTNGPEAVRILNEECLPACREVGDKIGEILALYALSCKYRGATDKENYAESSEQALALCREINHGPWLPLLIMVRGDVAALTEDYVRALTLYEEAFALDIEFHQPYGYAHCAVGYAALALGRLSYAETIFRDCTRLYAVGAKSWLPYVLGGFSKVAAAQGRWKRAAQLYGVADGQAQSLYGEPLPALHVYFESYISLLTSELGAEAFEAALAAGRALTLEQALAYALEEGDAES